MDHPKITNGLHLSDHIATDAWEEFYRMIIEYANIARSRRGAQVQTHQEPPVAASDAAPQRRSPGRLERT